VLESCIKTEFIYISAQICWNTCIIQVALKLNKLILEEPCFNCISAFLH